MRQKRNLFREVNDRISGIAHGDDRVGFVCECFDRACVERVFLRLREYESLRERPDYYVIAPGHRVAPFQRLIEETPRFALVQGRRSADAPARQLAS